MHAPDILERESLRVILQDICAVEVEDDGLIFEKSSIRIEEILEGRSYRGLRAKVKGSLVMARVSVQIDIGFSDHITPDPSKGEYPTILAEQPKPVLKMYPVETVIAEKFEAALSLGIANSRMKDFYDLQQIISNLELEATLVGDAIRNTLSRRRTKLPHSLDEVFNDEFVKSKQPQWLAFNRQIYEGKVDKSCEFSETVELLKVFLDPLILALSDDSDLKDRWIPHSGWTASA